MKKLAAVLLSFSLAFPTVTMAKITEEEMTSLILEVKEKIEVPVALSEFEYSERVSYGENYYSLRWTDKDAEIGYVNVTVDTQGNVMTYYSQMYDEGSSILAHCSYEEGLENAKAYMKEIVDYSHQLKLVGNHSPTTGKHYEYIFDYYVDDVKVFDQQVRVSVSKQTGEVTSFIGIDTLDHIYSSKQPEISLEEAQEIYEQQIGVELIHRIYSDYILQEMKTIPVYVVSNGNHQAIDAETGKIFTPYQQGYYTDGFLSESNKEESTSDSVMGQLTEAEQQTLEEVGQLLSEEEALKAARTNFPRLGKMEIVSSRLNKDSYTECYFWDLSGQQDGHYIRVTIDAHTGSVMNYYTSLYGMDQETNLSDAEVREKVEAFLEKIEPNKYEQVEYVIEEVSEKVVGEGIYPTRYYNYERVVEGVPVSGNGFYIAYDMVYDEVVSYTKTWNELVFEDVSEAVTPSQIIDEIGLELMYIEKEMNTYQLGYVHEDTYMNFDPFTIKEVNYRGEEVENVEQGIYTDLEGHPLEAIITQLFDSGIYLKGNQFRPDEVISQADLLRLIMGETRVLTDEEVQQRAVSSGLLEEDEVTEDAMTQSDAIKYLIRQLGYKEIAELRGIYKYPFQSEVKEELVGYISLAYGLRLIDQQSEESFEASQVLTRAETMALIHRSILVLGQ